MIEFVGIDYWPMPNPSLFAMNLFNPTLFLEVPAELMSVMHYFEDSCVMGCCGISALNLDVQRALDGIAELGIAKAKVALIQLEELIVKVKWHSGPVVSDDYGFGQHWDRPTDALSFLVNVHASLTAAVNAQAV